MSRLILYLFCLTTSLTTAAQTDKFNELKNDLLLRVPNNQTDSTTRNFLKKYVPMLADEFKGTWTAYPPVANSIPNILITHSLEFAKHPFVNIPMQDGRLVILTREQNGKIAGVRTYYVSFSFKNKKVAEQTFEKLCKMFTPISISKNIVQKDQKRIAVFRNMRTIKAQNNKHLEVEDEVQFVLTQDELYTDKYKIIFGTILDNDYAEHYGIR